MNIAVDAMGGNYAPDEIVKGVIEAVEGRQESLDLEITLVGDRKKISGLLEGYNHPDIKICHSSEVIYMDELPIRAVRQKRFSSIRMAFDLLKEKEVDAVVSAGNSGAFIAAAILSLGPIRDIEKPAIASILPGKNGPFILIDSGANVDCRSSYLYQFALLGHALAVSYLDIKRPRIALLSVGEEDNKGNRLVKRAYGMLSHSPLNFIGNIEGSDIFNGNVDVVVCDGFVGNVALKLCEGVAQSISNWIVQEIKEPSLVKDLVRRLDFEEYGGGVVLGINGLGILCHGRSSSKAIKNAIAMAAHFIEKRIPNRILLELEHISNNYKGESYGGI